jgi:hypothetical protein
MQLLLDFHRAADSGVLPLENPCGDRGTEPHCPKGGVGEWLTFAKLAHACSAVPAR